MTENLRVTRYHNGDSIKEVKEDTVWKNAKKGARCWYMNDSRHEQDQGMLYNWNAAVDRHGLCPEGWHVATYKEWYALAGMNQLLIQDSSFAIPAGYRDKDGIFSPERLNSQWWTSSIHDSIMEKAVVLQHQTNFMLFQNFNRRTGLSVRCVHGR
jgi:hypothetical protein